jgi:hypothetical protein
VTIRDIDGHTHSVEVTAATLFEAVALLEPPQSNYILTWIAAIGCTLLNFSSVLAGGPSLSISELEKGDI